MRILLIEDNPGDALLVRTYLEEADATLKLEHVSSIAEATARLAQIGAENRFDALLVDLSLPETQGLETVIRAQKIAGAAPVVVMTGLGDEDTALAAVQAGAQDYLVKGQATGPAILRALRYAAERARLRTELEASRERAELLSALSESLQGARSPLDVFALTASRIGTLLNTEGMALWHKPGDKLEMRWASGHGMTALSPALEKEVLTALRETKPWYQAQPQDDCVYAVEPVLDAAANAIAALVMKRCQQGAWLERERALLKSAAGTLGLALERADLIARLESSNANLEIKSSMALEAAKLVAWDLEVPTDRVTLSPNATEVMGSGVASTFKASEGWAFLHPDDLELHRATVRDAIQRLEPYRSKFRLWHEERRVYLWMEEYGVVRNQPKLSISGVTQDINDRATAEENLIESQQRLELALSSAGMGTWDWQLSSGLVFWGGDSDIIFGFPRGTTAIKLGDVMGVIHPEDQKSLTDALNRALEESDLDTEFRVVWPDRSVHYVLSRGRAVRDSRGNNLSVTGTTVDLTQIKRAEATLRHVNEAQKRFVGDAAHELRAPLTSIQGNLGLLRRYPDMELSERRAAIEDAFVEASRLGRLVTDMLALARGDSGEGLRHEPVHFDELVSETVRQAQHLTKKHRLEITEISACVVEGDRDRLKQLCLILLENAIKYTPEGGSVRVGLSCDPDWTELRIVDSGLGIAEEDLPHVFERFYRADKGRARGSDPGGTGLGLPIAQWVVAQHGGEIRLESQPGQGTTAVVKLPIAP